MMPQHQTLRYADLFSQRKHSIVEHHAPNRVRVTYNARGAMFQLLRSLPKGSGNTILLPAFHCVALVEPVVQAGYRVRYYRVGPDFKINAADLAAKLTADIAATVAVHFFGFPTNLDEVEILIRQHGSSLIEDCSHSFLSKEHGSHLGRRGDFAIFSYYKFAPSLVGGSLVLNKPDFQLRDEPLSVPIRQQMVLAKRLIEQAAVNSPNNPASALFLWLDRLRMRHKAGNTSSSAKMETSTVSAFLDDPYLFQDSLARATMPWLSRHIVEACDWDEFAAARRRNYQRLSELLWDTPTMRRVFPVLAEGIVPWAYPVLLKDRVRHEQQLRRLGVPLFTFGEVLHPTLSSFVDDARADAEAFSAQLMLLPIHHQLNDGQMEGFARIFTDYLESALVTPSASPIS